jgi:hypothetical protein
MQPTSFGTLIRGTTESAAEGVLLEGVSNLTTNMNRNSLQKKIMVRTKKNLFKAADGSTGS